MNDNENFPNANKIANDDDALYGEISQGKRVEFTPAPKGQQQGVLVDIRNLGMLPTSFEGVDTGEKPHVLVSWQLKKVLDLPIEEGDDEQTIEFKKRLTGQPYIVSQRYVNSLGDKAKMRKHFEAMLGRKLTDTELKPRGFPLEQMIGKNCTLDIVHTISKKDSKTYANINGVMGWNTDFGPNLEPRDYVRFKDRPRDENGNILKGEALKKQNETLEELRRTLRDGWNQGATYGVPIPVLNLMTLSADELRAEMDKCSESIKAARANLTKGGENLDSPTAILSPSEAFKKRTGHDPDLFADEGEPGFIENEDEREAIVRERPSEAAVSKPKNLMDAQASLAAVKADPSETPDNSNPFDSQSLVETARAQWIKTGTGELPAFLVSLFEAAEESELPISSDPLTNAVFLQEVNNYLQSDNRKTVGKLADLKAAPAGVVTKAIREGKIAF
jgi:hypothetical protein